MVKFPVDTSSLATENKALQLGMKQNMFKLGLKKYIYHAKGYNVIHAFLLSIIRCLSCNIFFLIFMLFVFYFVVFSSCSQLASRGLGLLQPPGPEQPVLEDEKVEQDPVAQVGQEHDKGGGHGVEDVVVGGGDDAQQDKGRVADAGDQEQDAGHGGALAALLLGLLQERRLEVGRLNVVVLLLLGGHFLLWRRLGGPVAGAPAAQKGQAAPLAHEPALVDEDAADAEGVSEMHAGHGGQLVDVLAAHEDAGGVLGIDRVDEAKLLGQQARRHARVDGKGEKGKHVEQRHGAADGAEARVVGRHVVVVGNKAHGAGDVDQGVGAVEDGEQEAANVANLGAGNEPLLDAPLDPAAGVCRLGV